MCDLHVTNTQKTMRIPALPAEQGMGMSPWQLTMLGQVQAPLRTCGSALAGPGSTVRHDLGDSDLQS
jgi:hypothetical protein